MGPPGALLSLLWVMPAAGSTAPPLRHAVTSGRRASAGGESAAVACAKRPAARTRSCCRLPSRAGAPPRALAITRCCAVPPSRDYVDDWDAVFEEAEQASVPGRQPTDTLHDVGRVRNRAYLVGVSFKQQRPRASSAVPMLSIEDSLDELAHLADTAGLVVCGRTFQNLSAPDNRTYVGTGKLEELLEQARSLDVDTLIFDDELRPSQARNVERVANAAGGSVRIVDRVELILDIFRQRAATREGFLQVQLARIAYQLPRLTRLWEHLERQCVPQLLMSRLRRARTHVPSIPLAAGREAAGWQ